jgi:hypothetical protein
MRHDLGRFLRAINPNKVFCLLSGITSLHSAETVFKKTFAALKWTLQGSGLDARKAGF